MQSSRKKIRDACLRFDKSNIYLKHSMQLPKIFCLVLLLIDLLKGLLISISRGDAMSLVFQSVPNRLITFLHDMALVKQ